MVVEDETLGVRPVAAPAADVQEAQRSELAEICSHLYLDLTADSSDPAMLAFMSPPPGALPYHGFGVLDIAVRGFSFGLISDFFNDPTAGAQGDGFVVAPDGSRAGLVRKLDEEYVFRTVEDTETRWGVWLAGIAEPLVDRTSAERVFAPIVAALEPHWKAWADVRV